MTPIQITPQILDRAKRKAASVGNLQGSITGSLSNVVGAIGEIIVADALGANESSTYDYDLIKDGRRIDVKTKRCTSAPKPFYECSIAAHGTKQDCDEYIFVRVLNNLQRAWILGRISKDEYYSKAVRHRRGEVDESNNFTFKSDCYNLEISELWPIQKHNYSTSA